MFEDMASGEGSMPYGTEGQGLINADWRKSALQGGSAGLWRWDHRKDNAQLCSVAADLLAGDAALAYRDLSPDYALAQVHSDDRDQLRSRLRAAAYPSPSQIGQFRVRSAQRGDRLVLLSGRTHLSEDGVPIATLGVVIDLTDTVATGDEWFAHHANDALDEAAHHGIAAYNAIQASGHASLVEPARLLLLAVGRVIAARMNNRRAHRRDLPE